MFNDIENTYKKTIEHCKNNQMDKLQFKEIKLVNSKLQKMFQDIDQVQRLNIDLNTLIHYQEIFSSIQKEYQNAKLVKTTKAQFSKKIAKILDLGNIDSTPNPSTLAPPRQKKTQASQINPKKEVIAEFNPPKDIPIQKPVQETKIESQQNSPGFSFATKKQPLPLFSAMEILSKQQENDYREKLNSIYQKKNKDQNIVSFKKQFENFESGIHSKKKKFTSSINQGRNQIQQKEQIISRLIFQNNQLREKLNNQVIKYQQIIESKQQNPFLKKEPVLQVPVQKFVETQQSILHSSTLNIKKQPQQNLMNNKVYYNNEQEFINKDELLDVQKYQVYNQLLKKENQEIYSKLHELEQVMETLAKQNMKLKEFQRSGTPSRLIPPSSSASQKFKQLSETSFSLNQKSFQEMDQFQKKQIQFQYVLPHQKNDIMKIIPKQTTVNDERLSNHSKSEKYKLSKLIQSRQGQHPYIKQQNILPYDINQKVGSDVASEFENSFDTFKVANSINQSLVSIDQFPKKYYENQKIIMQNKLRNTTKAILTRNKVAFFKNSLVLIKDDPNYEIAFKRSALNKDIDTCRFIFYVNNKSPNQQKLQINYQYDDKLYSVNPTEKIANIKAKSQSREQIIIYYKDNKSNAAMNFIICHFKFRQTTYDIILPLIFLQFKQGFFKISSTDTKTIIVSPDKQFSTPHLMNALIPLININENQNLQFLKGQKPYRSDTVINTSTGIQGLRLQWQNNLLKITGDEKWVDALAWILSQTKL